MKFLAGLIFFCLISGSAISATSRQISWFMYDDVKKTWCGFKDESSFEKKADELKPLESARVEIVSGNPSEITYQVQPESGDWVLADKYSFLPGRTELKRATIYAQTGVQVIQSASIHNGVATNLKLIIATNADGSAADVRNIDLPNVPIKIKVNQFRFFPIVRSLTAGSSQMLCG